jgi:hypothetical protein
MDNSVTLAGYKYYLDTDGSRPDVCVAFLDVEPDASAWVNGVCLPVDAAALEVLDARERNYERVDVTGAVDGPAGRTWTYAGREESRRRFEQATAAGRCVVARSYLELVEHGFRTLGDWDAFAASTHGEHPPVRDLTRVDL